MSIPAARSAKGSHTSNVDTAHAPKKRKREKEVISNGVSGDVGSIRPAVATEASRKKAKTASKAVEVPVAETLPIFTQAVLDTFKRQKLQIKTIREIVKTLNDTWAPMLLGKSDELKEKGALLEGVHPLCFLWAIFSHQETKDALNYMKGQFIPAKWNGFLGTSDSHDEGLIPSLNQYYGAKLGAAFQPEFEVFYKALNIAQVHRPALNALAAGKKWEDFVKKLLS